MSSKGRACKKKKAFSVCPEQSSDHLSLLSNELICKIMYSLPLREVLCLSLLSRKLQTAVQLHLGLCKTLHFSEGRLFGYLPVTITDKQLMILLTKCPRVEYVYGLNPRRIERRHLRGSTRVKLTISGVITALSICKNLKGVETSHLELMEAILHQLPRVKIVGHFRNHNGRFPIPSINRLQLPPEPLLSSLHLTGIEIPELPSIPTIEYLYLQWVRFTKAQPFLNFSAPALHTFVMRHCVGPGNPLRFVPMAFALAAATELKRLELVGMAFLGRLLQRVTEDNLRKGSFRKLEKLIFGACRNVVETDVGYLMLISSATINSISLQPSLSRDSLFLSLKMAESVFTRLQLLYVGFVDDFPRKGQWSRADLLAFGLDDILELPAPVTDIGMKIAGTLFPVLTKLVIYNCPHLVKPTMWYKTPDDRTSWNELQELTLSHCHCLRLEDFLLFLAYLPSIESVVLEDVFREPPKGCSYVGLSAGTGLGMSSAIVSNQQELIAVNGNAMEAVAAAPAAERDFDDDDDEEEEDDESGVSVDDIYDDEFFDRESELTLNIKELCGERVLSFKTEKCRHCGLAMTNKRDLKADPLDPQPGTSMGCCCLQPIGPNDGCGASKATTDVAQKRKPKKCYAVKMIDQECSVTVDDIKQETRWVSSLGDDRPTEGKRGRVLEGRASRYKQAAIQNRKSYYSTQMMDKASGTSDPILEDDYEQNLRVMSDTLLSLTVLSCGISDICLRHCPKLEHLEVESCRILRRIRLRKCPLLVKVSVSQCPKLDVVSMCKDMGRLPPKRNRILFLQPMFESNELQENRNKKHASMMSKFDATAVEKTALQSTLPSYNVCVVWDDGSTRDFRLIHRQIVYRWLNLINNINNKLISENKFSKGPAPIASKQREFPWGRKLHRIQGDLQDGRFEVCSDMPWIRDLWNAPYSSKASWPQYTGLYRPEHRGHTSSDICIQLLRDTIHERMETDRHLVPYTFAVYLHLSGNEANYDYGAHRITL